MDPAVAQALIGTAGVLVGAAITAVVGLRLRSAQAELTDVQAEQLRQRIYQGLTADLRAEMGRLRAELAAARAEADHLRRLVAELEGRLAALTAAEQRMAAELAALRAERDELRVRLAAAESTLRAKEREINDLKARSA